MTCCRRLAPPPPGTLPPALGLAAGRWPAARPLAWLLSELGCLVHRRLRSRPARISSCYRRPVCSRPVPLWFQPSGSTTTYSPVGVALAPLLPELEPRPALRARPASWRCATVSYELLLFRTGRPACHLQSPLRGSPCPQVPTGGAGLGRVVMAPEHCRVPDSCEFSNHPHWSLNTSGFTFGMALMKTKSGVQASYFPPRPQGSTIGAEGLKLPGSEMLPGRFPFAADHRNNMEIFSIASRISEPQQWTRQ